MVPAVGTLVFPKIFWQKCFIDRGDRRQKNDEKKKFMLLFQIDKVGDFRDFRLYKTLKGALNGEKLSQYALFLQNFSLI